MEGANDTAPLILITNDDGITSPGLAAAADALDPLGELLIVAPTMQQTSAGRSRSQRGNLDGRLFRCKVNAGGREWPAVAVNATPAMAVEHAIQELAPRAIDLVVSGINYGENIGTCVTVSGTIGAALEAAERGVPALAVSLEVDRSLHFAHDLNILDFSASIHFTRLFARKVLAIGLPHDVDVLKVEIPASATTKTDWRVTRQDRSSYYMPIICRRDGFAEAARVEYQMSKGEYLSEDSDALALAHDLISITPLSLDLTSRSSLKELQGLLGYE